MTTDDQKPKRDKAKRQRAILRILRERSPITRSELHLALKNAGFDVCDKTLKRDADEMLSDGDILYVSPDSAKLRTLNVQNA